MSRPLRIDYRLVDEPVSDPLTLDERIECAKQARELHKIFLIAYPDRSEDDRRNMIATLEGNINILFRRFVVQNSHAFRILTRDNVTDDYLETNVYGIFRLREKQRLEGGGEFDEKEKSELFNYISSTSTST